MNIWVHTQTAVEAYIPQLKFREYKRRGCHANSLILLNMHSFDGRKTVVKLIFTCLVCLPGRVDPLDHKSQ